MKTKMTVLLGIKHPIMCGGMMWLCKPELCAAISNAGAMGNITAAIYDTGEDLRKAIRQTREMTDKPFSINLSLLPSFRITKEMYLDWFNTCLAEKVTAFEISGAPIDRFLGPDTIKRGHDVGVKFIQKVGSVRHAVHAEHVGYDAVIAAGVEEGGHPLNDDVTTMVLTPRISESVKIPVISTGGIADGRGLAAALMLGAEGVMMASRFVATYECSIHNNVKDELVKRQEMDTVLYGQTIGLQGRAMKNTLIGSVKELDARHANLEEFAPLLSGQNQKKLWEDGKCDEALLPVGQSIGFIHDIQSCRELVEHIISQAETLLKNSKKRFGI